MEFLEHCTCLICTTLQEINDQPEYNETTVQPISPPPIVVPKETCKEPKVVEKTPKELLICLPKFKPGRNPKYIKSCEICKLSHKPCNGERPCDRCVRMNREKKCKSIVRGRYKKLMSKTNRGYYGNDAV